MLNFILSRMKAWMATLIPAVTISIMKSAETSFGFDIPAEIEIAIVSAVTGLVVHQVPNKT